ncbi:hypothetical protein GCM10009828_008600 [Actinoplanes couchii]|uniref:Uncharacterized protein n=1 Tax=Actinoplanes couchii TaxID=403638 RepID=A0ABQ3XP50_9ACTN|nr:hypothetical protein Aco03nite_087000 [Actinoplanes couchii]
MTAPASNRPSASEPGVKCGAAARIPTNADAHNTTVTAAAARAAREGRTEESSVTTTDPTVPRG